MALQFSTESHQLLVSSLSNRKVKQLKRIAKKYKVKGVANYQMYLLTYREKLGVATLSMMPELNATGVTEVVKGQLVIKESVLESVNEV